VAAASRRHRTRELTGGEVTRLRQCSGMFPEASPRARGVSSSEAVEPIESARLYRLAGTPKGGTFWFLTGSIVFCRWPER